MPVCCRRGYSWQGVPSHTPEGNFVEASSHTLEVYNSATVGLRADAWVIGNGSSTALGQQYELKPSPSAASSLWPSPRAFHSATYDAQDHVNAVLVTTTQHYLLTRVLLCVGGQSLVIVGGASSYAYGAGLTYYKGKGNMPLVWYVPRSTLMSCTTDDVWK